MKNLRKAYLLMLALAMAPVLTEAAGFDHKYTATTGDLNGDGLLDVYLKPSPKLVMIPLDDLSVPVPRRPEVAPFVLQRQSNNTFQIVSSLSGAQRGAISQWQAAASIIVETVDTNMDGVLDVLVSGIPNSDPLIVFAGAQNYAAPQAVKTLDASVRQFISDVHNWTMNPARIVEVTETGLYALQQLQLLGYLINGVPITGDFFDPQTVPDVCTGYYCEYVNGYGWAIYATIHYNQLQYQTSFMSQAAADLANAFDPTLRDTSVVAQSSAATAIANVLEQTFGVETMKGVLRNGGVREHESPADSQIEESRGFDILSEIAALIGALTTDASACRVLTSGEKNQLALGNGMQIRNIDRVRICNGGFLGIQGYLMAPNGHIYVGRGSGSIAWQADYSAPTVAVSPDRQLIVHEMFHVFQNRNLGCRVSNGCMLMLRIASLGNYCYSPIPANKTFWDHNMEQEAELVADRYIMRNGQTTPMRTCNQSTTRSQLETLVPPLFL